MINLFTIKNYDTIKDIRLLNYFIINKMLLKSSFNNVANLDTIEGLLNINYYGNEVII